MTKVEAILLTIATEAGYTDVTKDEDTLTGWATRDVASGDPWALSRFNELAKGGLL